MASTTTSHPPLQEETPTTEPVPGTEPAPGTGTEPGTEPTEAPVSPPEPAPEPGTPEPVEEPAEPEKPAEEPAEPTEPPPGAILSEKEMESAFRKLEAESTRHANRISEILGEDAQALLRCELCRPDIAGFRFNVEPTEDVKAAVRKAIGLPILENLKPDKYSRQCDGCDGAGWVTSRAHVSGQEKLSCYDCKGKGWLAVGVERGPGGMAAPTEANGDLVDLVLDDGIKRDMFGTPEGDPDYGKMPNMRSRPIEYWQQSQGQGLP